MAAVAGLSPEEVRAIEAAGGHDWAAADLALLRAVEGLVDQYRVDDDTWGVLADHFDDQALLEVLFVVGTYSCLAMVLNSAGLAAEDRRS
jgi:hypothetical protein